MINTGYWAVLPAGVRYDRSLTQTAKLLYAEISSLAQADGYCWAQDEYFAELFGCSVATVTRALRSLRAGGYIWSEKKANVRGIERHIYCGLNPSKGGIVKNDDTLDDIVTDDDTPIVNNDDTPRPTQYNRNNKNNNTTGARARARADEEKLEAEISQILADFAGDDAALRTALSDFRQDRRMRNKPIKTPLAAKRLINRLDKLSKKNHAVMVAILDQSIERGWVGVFELKSEDMPAVPNDPTEPERKVWTPGVTP